MVVTNKTHMSSEECYKILMRTSKKDFINKSWLIVLIAIVGLPVMIIGLYQKETLYIVMGAIFVALSFVYLGVTFYNIKRIPKMIKAKNEDILTSGATYSYFFRETAVEIEIYTNSKKNKLKIFYTDIKKINEFDDHYEIRFVTDYIIYVNKNGFTEKKMEEFFRKNITKTDKKKPRTIHNKMKNTK